MTNVLTIKGVLVRGNNNFAFKIIHEFRFKHATMHFVCSGIGKNTNDGRCLQTNDGLALLVCLRFIPFGFVMGFVGFI